MSATINIDATITAPGITAWLDGSLYTKFIPGTGGAPALPTHYIQTVIGDGTATAYVTTETAPVSPAKTIEAEFTFECYEVGTKTGTATTDSDAAAEFVFNLTALCGVWTVEKITNHVEQAAARILSQYKEVL